MVDPQLDALSVEMRRAIYTMLMEKARSVSDLAAELPISRPAVSQHLKVLVDADLAKVTTVGNRHVYSVDATGMAALRSWVDEMWERAMGRFADFAEQVTEETMKNRSVVLEPVVKEVTVGLQPSEAFDLFTKQISEWWPLVTHSVGGSEAKSVHVEPGVGGRIYEVTNEGAEYQWATITEWIAGSSLSFTWFPGQPESLATHVKLTFEARPGGTEVILVHSGWEARGAEAMSVREGYDKGWDVVLAEASSHVG